MTAMGVTGVKGVTNTINSDELYRGEVKKLDTTGVFYGFVDMRGESDRGGRAADDPCSRRPLRRLRWSGRNSGNLS